MEMSTILVCDDEKDIVSAISIYLVSAGFQVVTAGNGAEALKLVEDHPEIRLVLLDVMMPVMDGIAAMGKIREISNVPIILLTAKSEDTDKILGLTAGADDYITKPFNPMELMARVKSQLRRFMQLGGSPDAAEEANDILTVGTISLNDRTKEVTVDGESVALTRTEYDILRFLMQHPGEVFTPKEIYRNVWQEAAFEAENTVAVHIRHLR